MDKKNYAEVLIDGKIYTLGGAEDEHYLQRVASYINEKTSQLKRQEGFKKQSQEYQAVMIELNIADDYFKTLERAHASEKQRDNMEKETYSLKHELVTTQLRLENVQNQLDEALKKLEKAEEELLKVKAIHNASSMAGNNPGASAKNGNNPGVNSRTSGNLNRR